MKRRLTAYFHNHLKVHGIGYAAFSIVKAMDASELECLLYLPSAHKAAKSKVLKTTIPPLIIKVLYKFGALNVIHNISEWLFFLKIKKGDVVYLWPGFSIDLLRKIKNKGNIVVIENINCHQKTSRQILDREAQRLNVKRAHIIDQLKVDNETESLELCDYVFSPSPSVTQSLLDAEVTAEKILESSYGLTEEQYVNLGENGEQTKQGLEFVFIGSAGIRKGVHLLLEYWCAADINGTLKIIGNIDDSIKALIEPYRKVKNIQFIGFVNDIEKVYKAADVFVLPSLEEGSPLVTYLALGAGLPCVVSPMGGLGVVTHEKNGFIIDVHDKASWINAMQRLANSAELRQSQSIAAREASRKFLWANVGKQRAELLMQKLKDK